MTALVAGAVMLGMMAGTASAETPTIPDVHVIGTDPAEEAVRLGQIAIALANGCVASDGLCTSAVATVVDALGEVTQLVTTVVRGCSSDDGLCTKAATIANESLGIAANCINQALTDAGVSFTLDLPTSGLSCEDASLAAIYLAEMVVREAGACAITTAATCGLVFDAIALTVDRAADCAASAMNAGGAGGTSLGCGDAVYAVQAVASGLAGMLGGCLGNPDANADTTCRLITETATFVVDNIEGCVGALWVIAEEMPVPLPFGGTLNCFGVIDQANQSLDNLLQRAPDVPWTISPTPDCSITVAWPSVPGDPGSDSAAPENLPALIPPCYAPDSLTDGIYTPALPGNGLTPPACHPSRTWQKGNVWQDQLVAITGSVYRNSNVKESYHDTSVTVTGEVGMRVTSHVEVEAGIVFAKAKAALDVEIHTSLSVSQTFRVYNRVPPKTVDDVTFGVFRKVVSGHWTTVYDDCKRFEKDVMIKAPWKPGMGANQYPIE